VTAQVSTVPAPASIAEAANMVRAGLRYLADADPTTMAAQAQAECLQALEQGDAISTAARARILAAFTAGQGYTEDADYSPTSWLIHHTKISKGAARGHVGWAGRAAAHPAVIAALAEGTVLSESMARIVCGWTDKLPAECRQAADEILITAAKAGARKEDLAALAAEIYARSLPDSEDDPEPDFEDRLLRVETTFAGAGVISGDLTPECAAVVTTVLDALSAPQGAQDARTREQRYHDALEDAMRNPRTSQRRSPPSTIAAAIARSRCVSGPAISASTSAGARIRGSRRPARTSGTPWPGRDRSRRVGSPRGTGFAATSPRACKNAKNPDTIDSRRRTVAADTPPGSPRVATGCSAPCSPPRPVRWAVMNASTSAGRT
jgi:Domain of unknown function (DUF222)